MSIHPSLRAGSSATASIRNVMKRHERVRHLITQGVWTEGRSAFGLPKIKQAKVKARKAAGKEKEASATEKSAATPATGSATA